MTLSHITHTPHTPVKKKARDLKRTVTESLTMREILKTWWQDEQILKTSKKGLLFVHQSKDQRWLLERYGNEICMLDATYKTTRYSLPLFFVVVKTNIDYQIVGSCIVQSEATDAIFEGLSVLKSWNQKWNVPLLFYGWLFRRRNVSNWIVIPR